MLDDRSFNQGYSKSRHSSWQNGETYDFHLFQFSISKIHFINKTFINMCQFESGLGWGCEGEGEGEGEGEAWGGSIGVFEGGTWRGGGSMSVFVPEKHHTLLPIADYITFLLEINLFLVSFNSEQSSRLSLKFCNII
jgi:hypothetical protein